MYEHPRGPAGLAALLLVLLGLVGMHGLMGGAPSAAYGSGHLQGTGHTAVPAPTGMSAAQHGSAAPAAAPGVAAAQPAAPDHGVPHGSPEGPAHHHLAELCLAVLTGLVVWLLAAAALAAARGRLRRRAEALRRVVVSAGRSRPWTGPDLAHLQVSRT